MMSNRVFTPEELELAKELSYKNWEEQEVTEVGFEFYGQWITCPFVDNTGRFEFTDFDAMCEFYGRDNVVTLINKLLDGVHDGK